MVTTPLFQLPQAGMAPIHYAAINGHAEVLRALMEGKTDLLLKTNVSHLIPPPPGGRHNDNIREE